MRGLTTGDFAQPNAIAADDAMRDRMIALGHTVIDVDQSQATSVQLASSNIVVISESASSGGVNGNAFGANTVDIRNSLRAVVLMEPGLSDDFGLNGGQTFLGSMSSSSITLVNLASPYTDGFALGNVQITNGNQRVVGFAIPGATGLGFPLAEPTGTVLGQNLFGGFQGTDLTFTTNGPLNPGQLVVGIPFGYGSFLDRTAAGEQLFDNVIGAVPEPSTVVLAAMGALGLAWAARRKNRA
jgi:hypothetical protein